VPWWSVTKTALAAAALRLVADRALALDDPLDDQPYTLRQLLQHRAGVPNYGKLAAYHAAVARGDPPWTDDALLRRVDAARLDFPPDRGWAYSNVGYWMVRRLIERATGTDLARALRTLILDPLGLDTVPLATTPADLADVWGAAPGYHPGWVYHGLLVGQPLDAARFMHRVLGGALLPPDLLAAMTTPHPLGALGDPDRPWRDTGYGLGLMIGTMARDDGAIVAACGHSGGGPGSHCAVYRFPDTTPPRTVAVFGDAATEGVAEAEAVSLSSSPSS
jgi:CubicO group peptidase (beta-lactamase class C family)